jgi:hypothetical protein
MSKRYPEVPKLAPWEAKLPLLYLTQRDEPVYLVPSRCHKASLPANFTSDGNKMRDLRSNMITEPRDRFNRINHLMESFVHAKTLGEWEMGVNPMMANIKAKQLYHPKVLDPRN